MDYLFLSVQPSTTSPELFSVLSGKILVSLGIIAMLIFLKRAQIRRIKQWFYDYDLFLMYDLHDALWAYIV